MLRKFLKCDICGDTWDITNTSLFDKVSPGINYTFDKVKKGCRRFHIQTVEHKQDDRYCREDLDICDKCYNKLDKYIHELAKGDENERG